jgi:hypothetical protein
MRALPVPVIDMRPLGTMTLKSGRFALPGLPAEKAATVTGPPLTVTLREVGEKATPVLLGVTV